MLRIAVPNKGSLAGPAFDMLREAGYRTRRDPKELICTDPDNDVEFFYLRPRDIAVYVGSGTVDAGITGRDLLLDAGSGAEEVMALGFGASTFRYAARPGEVSDVADIGGRRVATSYPGLVEAHLAEHGVSAHVVRLDGAVETAITLGVADVIADVVETGSTLKAQGLAVFGEPILRSEAVFIRRPGTAEAGAVDVLRRRLPAPSRRDWNHPPSRRCKTPTGRRCEPWSREPRPTGSWTSSMTLAPGPSSSRTSPRVGCERAVPAPAWPTRRHRLRRRRRPRVRGRCHGDARRQAGRQLEAR